MSLDELKCAEKQLGEAQGRWKDNKEVSETCATHRALVDGQNVNISPIHVGFEADRCLAQGGVRREEETRARRGE